MSSLPDLAAVNAAGARPTPAPRVPAGKYRNPCLCRASGFEVVLRLHDDDVVSVAAVRKGDMATAFSGKIRLAEIGVEFGDLLKAFQNRKLAAKFRTVDDIFTLVVGLYNTKKFSRVDALVPMARLDPAGAALVAAEIGDLKRDSLENFVAKTMARGAAGQASGLGALSALLAGLK